MYAASNVGGIVYLTQNSLVWASSSSQRIATVVVSGTNNTIQAVQGIDTKEASFFSLYYFLFYSI